MKMILTLVALAVAGSSARGAELPQVTCDVLVVGGGSAGLCAAVQSGRAGAKTVLVEAAHQVGGNTTTVAEFPGGFSMLGAGR